MPETTAPAPITKTRLRFRKDGDLRFLSHHDLMRLFERLLRRAGLPVKHSEGFHPKPRIVFASALSLGVVGLDEAVEIEFVGAVAPEAARHALTDLAPEGLTFLSAKELPPRLTGQPMLAEYLLPLAESQRAGLSVKIDALLAQTELWIERTKQRELGRPSDEDAGEERLDAPLTAAAGKRPPVAESKRIDLRPYLHSLRLTPAGLAVSFRITPTGTARPEELLRLLGLDRLLLDGDAWLTRTRLVLADEAEHETRTESPADAAAERAAPASAPAKKELIHA